jgi:hypothetical protein
MPLLAWLAAQTWQVQLPLLRLLLLAWLATMLLPPWLASSLLREERQGCCLQLRLRLLQQH